MMKTQEDRGGVLLRRTIVLLAVAVVVAAMVAASAMPALAVRHREGGAVFSCTDGTTVVIASASSKQGLEKQGYTCTKLGRRV
jgi:hypothetical protein